MFFGSVPFGATAFGDLGAESTNITISASGFNLTATLSNAYTVQKTHFVNGFSLSTAVNSAAAQISPTPAGNNATIALNSPVVVADGTIHLPANSLGMTVTLGAVTEEVAEIVSGVNLTSAVTGSGATTNYTVTVVNSGGNKFAIIENEFVKPGKGQAFNRVKLRNLKTFKILERTFKSGDSLESADVIDMDMDFLYDDGEFWYFMDPATFEQFQADINVIGECAKWLSEQDSCVVTLFNGNPLLVTPPNHVELEIVETDPGLRGDTAQGGTKPAKLKTGAVVKVPLFLDQGDVIKVDTRSGEYLGRVR